MTCEVEATLVVQVMVAEEVLIPLTARLEITGAGWEAAVQVRVVIEYGGNESEAAALKLAIVLDTGATTNEFSLVSVILVDVSCVICTVPVGT